MTKRMTVGNIDMSSSDKKLFFAHALCSHFNENGKGLSLNGGKDSRDGKHDGL